MGFYAAKRALLSNPNPCVWLLHWSQRGDWDCHMHRNGLYPHLYRITTCSWPASLSRSNTCTHNGTNYHCLVCPKLFSEWHYWCFGGSGTKLREAKGNILLTEWTDKNKSNVEGLKMAVMFIFSFALKVKSEWWVTSGKSALSLLQRLFARFLLQDVDCCLAVNTQLGQISA